MSEISSTESRGTCTVEFEPISARVGENLSFSVRVVCDPPCDREGEEICLLDHEGNVICEATLNAYDGEGGNSSTPLEFVAPEAAGDSVLRLVVPACRAEAFEFPETITDCPVSIVSHQINLLVWDVPKAVTAGEYFKIKIGVKSTSGQAPEGWTAQVTQADGPPVEIPLALAEWPDSDGLYYVETEIAAPRELGLTRWQVTLGERQHDLPHEVIEASFGVHCTPAPDHTLEISVLDQETAEPLPNATVQLHPFRALTNEQGKARIALPRGNYKLIISAKDHFPYNAQLRVEQDMEESVALPVDREMTEADIW